MIHRRRVTSPGNRLPDHFSSKDNIIFLCRYPDVPTHWREGTIIAIENQVVVFVPDYEFIEYISLGRKMVFEPGRDACEVGFYSEDIYLKSEFIYLGND